MSWSGASARAPWRRSRGSARPPPRSSPRRRPTSSRSTWPGCSPRHRRRSTAPCGRRCAVTATPIRIGRNAIILNMDRTLLAPLRLSHYKDSSVNPAGQRARITEYAEDNDDHVIFVDVDMDVSGADPIRERPGLGPWLAPDKIGQIDGFLADEMDRLSRDMLDYLQFARDMAALG